MKSERPVAVKVVTDGHAQGTDISIDGQELANNITAISLSIDCNQNNGFADVVIHATNVPFEFDATGPVEWVEREPATAED